MRLAWALVVAVVLAVAVPVFAICPVDPEDCEPRYNVVMYIEPDWCRYETGDVVWDRTYVVNQQFVTDRWYVYHWSDQNSDERPADGFVGPYYVVGNSPYCGYITFP